MSTTEELLQQARVAAVKGDLSLASTYVSQVLQVAIPGSVEEQKGQVLEAKVALRGGDVARAESLLTQMLKRGGRTPRVLAGLGQLYEVQERWQDAALAYEEGITLSNGTTMVAFRQNAAWAWLMAKQPAMALLNLNEAAAQLPTEYQAIQQALTAFLLYESGQLDEALVTVETVQPGCAWATCVAAIAEASVYLKHGHLAAAQKAVHRAQEVADQSATETGTNQLPNMVRELQRLVAA